MDYLIAFMIFVVSVIVSIAMFFTVIYLLISIEQYRLKQEFTATTKEEQAPITINNTFDKETEAKQAKAIAKDKLRWVDELLSDEQKDWVEVIIKGLGMESLPLVVKEGVLFGGDEYIESQLLIMDENKRVQKEVLAAKEDPDKVRGIINGSMFLQMGTLTSISDRHAQSNALAQQMASRAMAQTRFSQGVTRYDQCFSHKRSLQQGPPSRGVLHNILGTIGFID